MKHVLLSSLLLSSLSYATENDFSEPFDYSGIEELNSIVDEIGCSTDFDCDELVKMLLSTRSVRRNANPGEDLDYAEIVDGVLSSVNSSKLYESEKILFNQSPYKGLKSLWYGNKANSAAVTYYQKEVLINGNGDAFRHSYWNALMVRNIDFNWAMAWSDAHEDWPGNPDLQKRMDNLNNRAGQGSAEAHPDFDNSQLEVLTLSRVDGGYLTRISNGSLINTDATGRK